MTQSTYDTNGDARKALQFVYANYGVNGIDDPKMLNQLLPDLLPGEPLEAHLFIAAANAGAARLLRDRLASMPAEAAVRDVAAMLVQRNALDPKACQWVVAEYASALGHPVTISPDPAPPAGPAAGTPGGPPIGNENATRLDTMVAGGFAGTSAPPAPPGTSPQGYPGTSPQGFPGTSPQGFPGASPQGYPGASPQGYPGTPQGYPGGSQVGAAPGMVSPVFGPNQPLSPQPMSESVAPYPAPYPQPNTPFGQPGYQFQQPPKKSRTPLIAGIVVGALVVIGGTVGAIVATSGGGGGTPTSGPTTSTTHTTAPPAQRPALTALLPPELSLTDDCTTNNTGDADNMVGITSGYECDAPSSSKIDGGHIEAYQFNNPASLASSLTAVNTDVGFDSTASTVTKTCPPTDGHDGLFQWTKDNTPRGTLECYKTSDDECAYIWTDNADLTLFYADTSGQDCSDMEDWWEHDSGPAD